MPGAIEDVAERGLAVASDRLGVMIEARSVDWSLGGTVHIEGLVVRERTAPDDEPPLLTVDTLTVDSDVAVLRRRVRLREVSARGVRVKLVRRASGEHNMAGVLRGLGISADRNAAPRGAGSGLGLGHLLDSGLPKVVLSDVSVTLTRLVPALPIDLAVPEVVTLSRGTVTVAGPPSADSGGEVAPVDASSEATVTARFAETSLDLGHGLAFDATLALPRTLRRAGVRFSRPVRFFLGRRVVGVGGLVWSPNAMTLTELQLSVPIDPDTPGEVVGAAATVAALRVEPGPMALMARAHTAGPRKEGDHPLAAWVAAADRVIITEPRLAMKMTGGGRHSFEDLVPAIGLPSAPSDPEGAATQGAAPPEPVDILAEAALSASVRLLQGRLRTTPKAPLRRRIIGALSALERGTVRLGRQLGTAAILLPLSHLEVVKGHVVLHVDGQRVAIDDLDATAEWVDDAVGIRARAMIPELLRKPAQLSVASGPSGRPVSLSFEVAGVPLSALSGVVPLLTGNDGVIYDAHGLLTWDGPRFGVQATAVLEDAAISSDILAGEPIADLDLQVTVDATLDAVSRKAEVVRATVAQDGLEVALTGAVSDYGRKPHLRGTATLAETPVQTVIDAIPTALRHRLRGLSAEGTLAWTLGIDLDTVDVDGIAIDSKPVLKGFRVTSLGQHVDIPSLQTAVTYQILRQDGSQGIRTSGPLSGRWTPLEEITPYLVKAVTTTEDGRFYTHRGISTAALEESLITNLKRGRFARGGSTITQQLVKNLYLGADKTVGRKLQELFIATELERALSKEEIMALYLNVIEFGPGIYGVTDAAERWFGKLPSELTLLEAIFLSSIIPNPRKYYEQFFLQGGVGARWRGYLEGLLGVMVERGKVSPGEVAAQAPFSPIFVSSAAHTADSPAPRDGDDEDLPDNPWLEEPEP